MKKKVDRNVILTGFTSFFTDISSEMVYPLMQAFVSIVMSTQKALLGPILGIIEGLAESTASLLKVFSGYFSDKASSRKPFVIVGYSLSVVGKCLLFLGSFSWLFILSARFSDRFGKGIRSAPRDALIIESTPKEQIGYAFGFHRAMDYMGAVLGIGFCYFLSLQYLDEATKTIIDMNGFYTIFMISLVPAIISIIFLFFIKEKKSDIESTSSKPILKPTLSIKNYDKNLKVFFLAIFIFTLGNSSNQFLLLRSMDLGMSLSTVILMYGAFNIVTTIFSTFFGGLSDKIGRIKILISGYLLYSLIYISFGFVTNDQNGLLWLFWILYGLFYALTEGIEKAFVSDLSSKENKGTALGFFHTITGIGLLPASIIAGLLFQQASYLPFIIGGGLSLLSIFIMLFGIKFKTKQYS